jgi:import receptor subunit TOM22
MKKMISLTPVCRFFLSVVIWVVGNGLAISYRRRATPVPIRLKLFRRPWANISPFFFLINTESEISVESDAELESENLYERIIALKDIIPPHSRRRIAGTVTGITDFTKSTFSFSGKALWVISTSAFLLGVPWALAFAEEEQYAQMEKEQGMMKGANEVCFPVWIQWQEI